MYSPKKIDDPVGSFFLHNPNINITSKTRYGLSTVKGSDEVSFTKLVVIFKILDLNLMVHFKFWAK